MYPVPQTQGSTTPTPPVFPPGRYGHRREPRRRRRVLPAVALLAVLVATLAVAARMYQMYGDTNYEPEVLGYTDITDNQIKIRFRVRLPEGKGAVCAVRARSHDGAVVGRAEVPVPAGSSETTYRLTTEARPFIGEVTRCWPAD